MRYSKTVFAPTRLSLPIRLGLPLVVWGLSLACTKTPSGDTPTLPASEGASAPAQKPTAETPRAEETPFERETGPLTLGGDMPSGDVKMKSVDGTDLTLADIKGDNGVLVVFTCNHCPYAQAWEKRVTEIGNKYSKKGIGVVAVNPNDPAQQAADGFEEMQARAEKLKMDFPYVVDATSNVARDFGATKTPEVYLFNAQGSLVYRGAVDDSANKPDAVEEPYLKDALTALLDGEAIEPAETKAVGCSIKFRPEA